MEAYKQMNVKELAAIINKHLMEAWEDIEQSKTSNEEHYACGWIDCCNKLLKELGQPTPTDLETVLADQGADQTKH